MTFAREFPKQIMRIRYKSTVTNMLSPRECARCGSLEVAHHRDVRADRFLFLIVFGLHQSVEFTAPLCDDCNARCDKRAAQVFFIMKMLFVAVALGAIFNFITRPAFDAFWATVGWTILAIMGCCLLGFVICPRLVRFNGKTIRPLRRQ